MSADLKKMFEANRKMFERQHFVLEGYNKIGEIGKGLITGEKNSVDLKEAEIDVYHNADFRANLKGARQIIGELKDKKEAAEYNNDSETTEACQRLIKKYMPEGLEELVAGR